MVNKLLFVDDESSIVTSAKVAFKEEIKALEYEVLFADSGEKALAEIERDKERDISTIILDLKMPAAQMDGWQLLQELKQRRIEINLVLVSAFFPQYGYENLVKEYTEGNVVLMIPKPLSFFDWKPKLKQIAQQKSRFNKESVSVAYNTLLKVVKELPEKKRVQLFQSLLDTFSFKSLKYFEGRIVKEIQERLEKSLFRDKLRVWLLEQQEKGELDKNIPLKDIEYFFIEERFINGNGPYYYLRWAESGKHRVRAIPKMVSDKMPLSLKEQIAGRTKPQKND